MIQRLLSLFVSLGLAVGCAGTPEPQTPADPPQAAEPQASAAAPAPAPPAPAPPAATTSAEAGGETSPAAEPGPLARIVDSGGLRIGTSGEQPPLSMTTRTGDLIGLDVAIGRVLASTMGVEARFVRLPFGELLDRLVAGELDIVLSGVAITPERVVKVDFAGPYYTSGKAILTRRADLNAATSVADVDLPSLTFAVLAGSTSESFARTQLSGANVMATPHLDEAIRLVIDGGADALIADFETCHYAVLRNPGQGLLEPIHTYTVEPMGVAVSHSAPRLGNLIDTYLEALEKRGVLKRTKDFWLEDPSWVEALEPVR